MTPTPPSAMERYRKLITEAEADPLYWNEVAALAHTVVEHLQAQLRERERELRDTTTALAAAHHELERTDQVRADLAEREREVEQAINESAALIWRAVADLVAAGTPADGIGVIARGNAEALLTRRRAPEGE